MDETDVSIADIASNLSQCVEDIVSLNVLATNTSERGVANEERIEDINQTVVKVMVGLEELRAKTRSSRASSSIPLDQQDEELQRRMSSVGKILEEVEQLGRATAKNFAEFTARTTERASNYDAASRAASDEASAAESEKLSDKFHRSVSSKFEECHRLIDRAHHDNEKLRTSTEENAVATTKQLGELDIALQSCLDYQQECKRLLAKPSTSATLRPADQVVYCCWLSKTVF